MVTIPRVIPRITVVIGLSSSASGIRSKQTTDIIRPEANDRMKLRNLFDFLLMMTPMIPPSVVPNVPKNSPKRVVFIVLSNLKTPLI